MTTKAKGESVRQKLTTAAKKMDAKFRDFETICAEKLHTLISHEDQNSRSKDVHNLEVFLSKTDPKTLKKAIKNCFEFRRNANSCYRIFFD